MDASMHKHTFFLQPNFFQRKLGPHADLTLANHCFFSLVTWKSAASMVDHMNVCLCLCLHNWVREGGILSLTGTHCTSAAGSRQVNSAELDSHLWTGFPEVASGCCLGHICDRTFHIMENADTIKLWWWVKLGDCFYILWDVVTISFIVYLHDVFSGWKIAP